MYVCVMYIFYFQASNRDIGVLMLYIDTVCTRGTYMYVHMCVYTHMYVCMYVMYMSCMCNTYM